MVRTRTIINVEFSAVLFFLFKVAIIIGTKDAIYLSVEIRGMGCRFQMRTFDMVLFAYLGGLTVEQPLYKSLTPGRDTLYLIDNTHGSEENLLDLKFVQVIFLMSFS